VFDLFALILCAAGERRFNVLVFIVMSANSGKDFAVMLKLSMALLPFWALFGKAALHALFANRGEEQCGSLYNWIERRRSVWNHLRIQDTD
jgi:hypothetical protein